METHSSGQSGRVGVLNDGHLKYNSISIQVLAVAQVFGLMPVQSISSSNPHRMSFEWRSLRTLQACMYVFYGGSIVVASLRAVIKNDGVVTPKNIGERTLVVNPSCATDCLCFQLGRSFSAFAHIASSCSCSWPSGGKVWL